MVRTFVCLCVLAALWTAPARAADQAMHAKSPKAEFTLSHELVVGTATLKPGAYRFQCVTVGDAEFLVVTNDEGKEVARVPCRPEELTAKNDTSDFRFTRRADGMAELTAVRIRGERLAHRVVMN